MPKTSKSNSTSAKKRGTPKKVRDLATAMDLLRTNEERKSEAALMIGDLVMRGKANRRDLVANTDCVSLLVALMRDGVGAQRDSAAKGLSNLLCADDTGSERDLAAALMAHNGIDVLAQLVSNGTPDQRDAGSAVLCNLLIIGKKDALTRDIRAGMMRANVIPAVVKLLTDAATEDQVHHALGILSGLARDTEHAPCEAIVASGALPPLVHRLARGTASQKVAAASAVCNLASTGRVVEILVEVNVVPPLVALVARGAGPQQAYATLALSNLADQSERAKSALLNAGATPALRGVLTDRQVERDVKRLALELLKTVSINGDANGIALSDDDDDDDIPVVHVEAMCSGVPAPEHLRPEHGYVYPLQKTKSCNARCLHMRCLTYPDCLDLTDEQAVREWTFCVCCAHHCDPDVLDQCLSAPDDRTLPDNIVVRTSKETASGIPEVYAFMVSDDDERQVYVLDVSMHPVRGLRANELPQVVHAGRRAAFAQLSDAIEASASVLTDGQYKALYDAAMAAHEAAGP